MVWFTSQMIAFIRAAKEHAHELFKRLAAASSDEQMVRAMCEAVGGSIDFVKRGDETHLARMPRLAWWSRVLEGLGRSTLVVSRVIPPLQRTWEHIKRAVLPSLALIRTVVEGQGYGDFLDVLDEQMSAALEKINWQKQGRRALGISAVECFG